MSMSGNSVTRWGPAHERKDDLFGDFQLECPHLGDDSDEELGVDVDNDNDGLRAIDAATALFQDRITRRRHEFQLALRANGCLVCFSAPIEKDYSCTKSCAEWAHDQTPRLLPVPPSHNIWTDIQNHFTKSWRHTKKKCPQVQKLYNIVCSKKINDNYNSYLARIESKRKFASSGQPAGNELTRWHGTVRDCALGDTGNDTLCQSKACSLCGIIRSSFDLAFFGRKTGWGRFGRGIYASATSSKSDDYAQNTSNVKSTWKALLLNKVVVGRGQTVLQNAPNLKGPSNGFDSILAEPGKDLNYDEVVVYDNRAIMPSYLVVYQF